MMQYRDYDPEEIARAMQEDEALQAFIRSRGMEVYCAEPNRVIAPSLTPSPGGRECLGNGKHPEYECCCDECSHYLICFPNWKEQG